MSRLTKWQRQFISEVSKMSSSELFDALTDEFNVMESLGGEYDRWKFDVVMNEVRERFSPSAAPSEVIDFSKEDPWASCKRYWFISGQLLKDGHWRPWNATGDSVGMFSTDEVEKRVREKSGGTEARLTWWKEISEDEYNALS